MKSNKELIEYYREKHRLEPVFFSKKQSNCNAIEEIKDIVVPLKLDLRQYCSPTDNQGETSHCVAFSVAQILEAIYWKENGKLLQLDAAHIYAKAKEIDGYIKENGTFPEIGLKAGLELAKDILPMQYDVKQIYNDSRENTIKQLKRIIHKNSFLAMGFNISEDWYELKKGNSLLESISKKSLGGHCVCAVGYFNDSLIVQNSWGKAWGAMGFARISWNVVLKQFVYAAYLERKI